MDMENQVFWLQQAVKKLMKKFDDLIALGGIPGPQGEQGPIGPQGPAGSNGLNGINGVDGEDGETPDLTNYIHRSEIFREGDGLIRIGTNNIDWFKFGRVRFSSDGLILHIADSSTDRGAEIPLNLDVFPDVEYA
jgi:hypothetical protein